MGLISPVEAREYSFKPAIGEVLSSSADPERVIVTEDGGLQALSYSGKMLSGFPIYEPGKVFVSSPLIEDVTGDGNAEIIIVARDAGNVYSLEAYNVTGVLIGSKVLSGVTVYYDPIFYKSGTQSNILIPVEDGRLLQLEYSGTNFTSTQLFTVNKPFTVASNGTDLYITYPEVSGVDVYKKSWN